ncbi:rhodanese-like domain-containing protein [Roseibium litorale]|uniref:Thiosulfate sulfurtransferase n=1 Tax=Roseibium litorale TaxID=2803841 RepID=A0ABR9CSR0_9HYPH|nr:rhodanese-like domain-containing protein [Roseibium litorale]MBD8893322.1 thiosulfate sulfurtransferase [Roseibium litorale]
MFPRKPYRHIDVTAARDKIAREDVVVIDVRDAKAYKKSHITGARHVTIANLASTMDSIAKDRPVLIYCYRGYASQEYGQTFSDFRFQEVYSLDGGYDAWKASEMAIQSLNAKEVTLKEMALS